MHRTLALARDAATVVASVALAAIAWDTIDWRFARDRDKTAERRANPHGLTAEHGWLHRVGGGYADVDTRPATAAEAEASAKSAEFDGGDGVFARSFESAEPIHPWQPEYGRPGLSYYVVRDHAAA